MFPLLPGMAGATVVDASLPPWATTTLPPPPAPVNMAASAAVALPAVPAAASRSPTPRRLGADSRPVVVSIQVAHAAPISCRRQGAVLVTSCFDIIAGLLPWEWGTAGQVGGRSAGHRCLSTWFALGGLSTVSGGTVERSVCLLCELRCECSSWGVCSKGSASLHDGKPCDQFSFVFRVFW